MKFMKPYNISKFGNSIVIPVTEAIKILGWNVGDIVNVSVPDEHIEIRKIPTTAKSKGKVIRQPSKKIK